MATDNGARAALCRFVVAFFNRLAMLLIWVMFPFDPSAWRMVRRCSAERALARVEARYLQLREAGASHEVAMARVVVEFKVVDSEEGKR